MAVIRVNHRSDGTILGAGDSSLFVEMDDTPHNHGIVEQIRKDHSQPLPPNPNRFWKVIPGGFRRADGKTEIPNEKKGTKDGVREGVHVGTEPRKIGLCDEAVAGTYIALGSDGTLVGGLVPLTRKGKQSTLLDGGSTKLILRVLTNGRVFVEAVGTTFEVAFDLLTV